MGLNEDLGDRENIGNASVSVARTREERSVTDFFPVPGNSDYCANCGTRRFSHAFLRFCPPPKKEVLYKKDHQ